MKLEKFYAESMPQAMMIIQKKLGPDAVIYSQVKSGNFVEVVAGLPSADSKPDPSLSNAKPIKTTIDDRMVQIKKLDNSTVNHELEMIEKRNLLHYKLRELKFSHTFIERFVDLYSSHCSIDDIVNDDQIIKMLLTKIQVAQKEFIDEKKVCAVVGPTGVGKSTTIAKLAKRFISRYGSEALGIISTDFQRIINKNQFQYFGSLLNVQVEYALNIRELQQSIHLLDSKRLILIDTAGVNQNDNKKIAELFQSIEVDSAPISLYLVLPCNLQTEILEDVVNNFTLPNTEGCIVTKNDECKSIAPCLSVILNNHLTISYVCGGQNISKDIEPANKVHIVNDVFRREETKAQGEARESCGML
jgi:flagellar biosynthesis protein FlhF